MENYKNSKCALEYTVLIFFLIFRLSFSVPYSCYADSYGVGLFDIILMICELLPEFREEFIYKIIIIDTEETSCSL